MGLFSSPKKTGTQVFSNKDRRGRGPLIQMRMGEDGKGVLIINGSRMIILNDTATEYVKHYLLNSPDHKVVSTIRKRYAVSKNLCLKDWNSIRSQMKKLEANPDKDPLEILKVDMVSLGEIPIDRPVHLYVYLTFDDKNSPKLTLFPKDEGRGLMVKKEWEVVIKKIADLGIMHVTFCGGEPSDSPVLEELISISSIKGMAVGLETNGAKLSDKAYLSSLKKAGLDHVQIKFPSSNPKVYANLMGRKNKAQFKQAVKGIENSISLGMEPTVLVRLTRESLPRIGDTLKFLAEKGISIVMLDFIPLSNYDLFLESGVPRENVDTVLDMIAKETPPGMVVKIITPLDIRDLNKDVREMLSPVSGIATSMAVSPEGRILAHRYLMKPLGDVITGDWKKIWDHPAALKVRGRTSDDLTASPEWLYFPTENFQTEYELVKGKSRRM